MYKIINQRQWVVTLVQLYKSYHHSSIKLLYAAILSKMFAILRTIVYTWMIVSGSLEYFQHVAHGRIGFMNQSQASTERQTSAGVSYSGAII